MQERLRKGTLIKSSKKLTKLLPRDGHLCGVHVGGCSLPIKNKTAASIDHIFTQSFFKDREYDVKSKDYNRDWNLQPMHLQCNNERGGQIYGFPLFTCHCHWLQIDRTVSGHVLMLHYKLGKDGTVFPVCTEENSFVFENPSAGKFASELGSIEIGGAWSFGQLEPGKRGITGKGQMGHAFPRISPNEVPEFNQLEMSRIRGVSSPTIEKFNLRMDTMRIQVFFEVVE